MDYYAMVEQCWQLSEAARDYTVQAGRDVAKGEVWERVFAVSPLVDIERTLREAPQFDRIYLRSPYGLQYRGEHKDWIPFRHGAIDLSSDATL